MKNVYVLMQLLGFFLFFFVPPLGFLLGVVLIIIGGLAYRKESNKMQCPSCKEMVIKGAQKCRYCGEHLESAKISTQ